MEHKVDCFVNRFKMLKFWLVAFFIIIFQTMKGNSWHMIRVGFDFGIDEDGKQVRKNLMAKREVGSGNVYWEPNLRELLNSLSDET